ncbi:MAG: hypothetical protein U0790_26700 [Isosphaeraceae bacterium]
MKRSADEFAEAGLVDVEDLSAGQVFYHEGQGHGVTPRGPPPGRVAARAPRADRSGPVPKIDGTRQRMLRRQLEAKWIPSSSRYISPE